MSKTPHRVAAVVDFFTMEDVHAYLAGRLDPDRQAAFEQLLATDDHAAEQVAAYREQNRRLRQLFAVDR